MLRSNVIYWRLSDDCVHHFLTSKGLSTAHTRTRRTARIDREKRSSGGRHRPTRTGGICNEKWFAERSTSVDLVPAALRHPPARSIPLSPRFILDYGWFVVALAAYPKALAAIRAAHAPVYGTDARFSFGNSVYIFFSLSTGCVALGRIAILQVHYGARARLAVERGAHGSVIRIWTVCDSMPVPARLCASEAGKLRKRILLQRKPIMCPKYE